MASQCHPLHWFAEIPSSRYRCPIDGDVVCNAVRSTTCGHTFGMSCALEFIMQHEKCPVCGCALDCSKIAPAMDLRNEVDRLEAHCLEPSCTWRGPLSERAGHHHKYKEDEDLDVSLLKTPPPTAVSPALVDAEASEVSVQHCVVSNEPTPICDLVDIGCSGPCDMASHFKLLVAEVRRLSMRCSSLEREVASNSTLHCQTKSTPTPKRFAAKKYTPQGKPLAPRAPNGDARKLFGELCPNVARRKNVAHC